MYKKLILASALSLSVLAAPAALAHDSDRHHRKDSHGWSQRYDHDRHNRRDHDRHAHDNRHEHRRNHDHRHHDRRHHDSRYRHVERERHWVRERYRVARYQPPRHYVRHHWRAGERMPAHYRTTRYVVHDYRHYQLYSPPRGHHWVRVDNDVVLTAVATGLITAAVYGIFY